VSFRYPDQLGLVLECCQSFAVDNGAFSAWKNGDPVTDWSRYYEWVAELHRYPTFDFAVSVGPSGPPGDIKAVLAWMKAHPEKANYASSGSGGVPHFAGLLIANKWLSSNIMLGSISCRQG
jgi:tripartite-type tricarboxylate transporter receptor subunit TctC